MLNYFFVNVVNAKDIPPSTTLNSYLRENLHLTGTKFMCLEGGCGSCIVAVEETVNGNKNVFAVNSVSYLSIWTYFIYNIIKTNPSLWVSKKFMFYISSKARQIFTLLRISEVLLKEWVRIVIKDRNRKFIPKLVFRLNITWKTCINYVIKDIHMLQTNG